MKFLKKLLSKRSKEQLFLDEIRKQLPDGYKLVNSSPQGIDPFWEITSKKMNLYFGYIDKIENAWKKQKYRQLVELCNKQIELYLDFSKAIKLEHSINSKKTFSPPSCNGYERLSMHYERNLKNYKLCLLLCYKAKEEGYQSSTLTSRMVRCQKKIS